MTRRVFDLASFILPLAAALLFLLPAGCGDDSPSGSNDGVADLTAVLALSGQDGGSVAAGDTLDARLTLVNAGDRDASGARVIVPYSGRVRAVRVNSQSAAFGPDSLLITSVAVSAGEEATFTIQFFVPQFFPDSGEIRTQAILEYDPDGDGDEPVVRTFSAPSAGAPAAPSTIEAANPNGETFRLFAPGVPMVYVSGSFNGWAAGDARYLMFLDPEGMEWAITVPAPGRHEYKFILRDSVSGPLFWIGDPRSREVTGDGFGGLNSVGGGPLPPPVMPLAEPLDRTKLVIYELFVDDFSGAGTFNAVRDGLRSGLPDLEQLGVNAIELLPVTATPPSFNWGYEPHHYFAVDPDYGTPADFATLITAAHEAGMAVLLDMVFNHVGGGSPLEVIDAHGVRGTYMSPTQPNVFGMKQVNWESPAMREFFLDVALYWIEQYEIDGFRMDFVDPEDYAGYRWWRDRVKEAHPEVFIIGEDWSYEPGSSISAAGFDATWGGQHTNSWGGFANNFQNILMALLKEGSYSGRMWFPPRGSFNTADNPMWALANVLAGTEGHPTAFHAVKYVVSHDERRVVDEVNRAGSPGAKAIGGIRKAKLGAVTLFTAAGIPMFYMGEEIGEDDYTPDSPAPNPVDWAQGNAGIRATYRNLIALRLTHPSLASGGIDFRCPSWSTVGGPCQQDKIVNYWRYAGTDASAADLVVAANFDHTDHAFTVSFPGSGTWHRWDPETGETAAVEVAGGALPVVLPASTAFLYVRNPSTLP